MVDTGVAQPSTRMYSEFAILPKKGTVSFASSRAVPGITMDMGKVPGDPSRRVVPIVEGVGSMAQGYSSMSRSPVDVTGDQLP